MLVHFKNIIFKVKKFIFRRSVLHQKKVHTAGYGVQFDYGEHDPTGDHPGTYTNPTKKSSCMTTEEGPVDSRFEYCDTQKVNLS